MSKKLILVLIVIFFSSPFALARASVVINEVQLSPTEGRFLELYNTDDSAVDLTNWYIQRKTATGSTFGSLVSKTNFEGKTIGAHDYFVISRVSLSNSDIVIDNLTLTESNTIQIKNSEGAVVDKVGWGDASDCNSPCPANPGEGKSIQKIQDGSWINATPTIGLANYEVPPPDNGDDGGGGGNGGSSGGGSGSSTGDETTPAPKPRAIVNPIMKVKISANTLAFSGEPLWIKTDVWGHYNENVILGRAYWNFGDGGALEQINNFEKFSHTYYYPGEYVLFLEYYENTFSKTPETTSKMIIKVLPTTVTISKVGDAKDFFIELSNNATSDIDISNWVINANGKIFILPKNSVILSKKTMTISGKVTGFNFGDQSNLKLFSGTGELVFDYSSSALPVKTLAENSAPTKISKAVETPETTPVLDKQIPEENLSASVLDSGILEQDGNHSHSSLIIPLASIIFIGASAGAVYFIRRKKLIPQAGSDFEILDE